MMIERNTKCDECFCARCSSVICHLLYLYRVVHNNNRQYCVICFAGLIRDSYGWHLLPHSSLTFPGIPTCLRRSILHQCTLTESLQRVHLLLLLIIRIIIIVVVGLPVWLVADHSFCLI
eukprot:gene6761-4852_t